MTKTPALVPAFLLALSRTAIATETPTSSQSVWNLGLDLSYAYGSVQKSTLASSLRTEARILEWLSVGATTSFEWGSVADHLLVAIGPSATFHYSLSERWRGFLGAGGLVLGTAKGARFTGGFDYALSESVSIGPRVAARSWHSDWATQYLLGVTIRF